MQSWSSRRLGSDADHLGVSIHGGTQSGRFILENPDKMDEKWGKQEKSGDHVLLNYGYASLLNPIFEEIKAV